MQEVLPYLYVLSNMVVRYMNQEFRLEGFEPGWLVVTSMPFLLMNRVLASEANRTLIRHLLVSRVPARAQSDCQLSFFPVHLLSSGLLIFLSRTTESKES